VKVKNLAHEYNIMPWTGLELRPLHLDTGALTMRPARLPNYLEGKLEFKLDCAMEDKSCHWVTVFRENWVKSSV